MLVESAIVAPAFFLLIFGVLEAGLAYRDYVTASDAVHEAARIGAIVGPDLLGDGSNADFRVLSSLRDDLSGLNSGNIERVVVFRAAPAVAGPPDAQVPSLCKDGTAIAGVCNVYDPVTAFEAVFNADAAFFVCTDGTQDSCDWDPAGRDNGPDPSSIEYIGVWLKVNRPSLTSLFGDRWEISQAAILRLEPGSVG